MKRDWGRLNSGARLSTRLNLLSIEVINATIFQSCYFGHRLTDPCHSERSKFTVFHKRLFDRYKIVLRCITRLHAMRCEK